MTEKRLPTVSTAPRQVESASVRLVGTLTVAGAVAGLAIALVQQWAQPRIEAWRAEVLSAAVTEVLAGADRYETLFLAEDGLTRAPAGDTAQLDRVYVGFRAGVPVGVAMVGEGGGFQDVIRVIFGYDPGSHEVIGMQVLESKETPGLGDKIHHDSAFIDEFGGVGTPLVGLRAGRESGTVGEVTMITGATISSRAIIDIINARLDDVGASVDGFWRSTAVATGPSGSSRSGGGVP